MSMVRFGIVGCGGAAVDVVDAVRQLADASVTVVHDVDDGRAKDLATRAGARAAPSIEALLDDADVDVVYVGLPHDLLAPTVAAAIEHDRHVLAEKPLALDAADARRLGDEAARRALVLGVLFEFRVSAPVLEARRLLAEGAIGALRSARIQTVIDKPASYWTSGPSGRVPDSWRASRARAGGGVVLMNAIHQLDVLRWITGRRVVRVVGDIVTRTRGIEVEDVGGAVLRLDDGSLVTLTATAHSHGAEHQERIEIDGDRGRLDLPDPYGMDRLRWFARDAGRGWQLSGDPTGPSHVPYLARFCAAVRDGGDPPAGAEDAAAALDTVLGIYRSATSGRAVDLEAGPVRG
jgi:predicted dehydrogenase